MDELILKERKIRQDIVELINNSGLPAFILKPIIKEMYEQICKIEEEQYNIALKNKEEKEEENNDQN